MPEMTKRTLSILLTAVIPSMSLMEIKTMTFKMGSATTHSRDRGLLPIRILISRRTRAFVYLAKFANAFIGRAIVRVELL